MGGVGLLVAAGKLELIALRMVPMGRALEVVAEAEDGLAQVGRFPILVQELRV